MSSEMQQPPRRDVPSGSQRAPPFAPRREEIASVPRRYGPGTLLVITAAYAVLFAGFKALGADQAWWIGTAVFLTGIGIAQMIGGPKRARGASALAGLILFPLAVVAASLSYWATTPPNVRPDDMVQMLTVGLPCAFVFGAPLGYLGGTVVAGVFLLMRYADTAMASLKRDASDEDPFEPDIDEKNVGENAD